MQKLLPLVLIIAISLSCSDDDGTKSINQENIYGFWIYKSVTYNGKDISKLSPGFTVSNYLHLHDDFTYGKCYILGNWSIDQNQLYLSSPSGNEPG